MSAEPNPRRFLPAFRMTVSPKFARRVFFGAGLYGIAVLVPHYFLEERLARVFPPALTHPEHYYGFLGVALAWQFAFLVIARDVVRFRPLMLPAALEKLLFVGATLVLWAKGRVPADVARLTAGDLLLGLLFLLCHSRLAGTKAAA